MDLLTPVGSEFGKVKGSYTRSFSLLCLSLNLSIGRCEGRKRTLLKDQIKVNASISSIFIDFNCVVGLLKKATYLLAWLLRYFDGPLLYVNTI